MGGLPRAWWVAGGAALVAAAVASVTFSVLDIEHDPVPIALIGLAAVATGTVVLATAATGERLPWTTPRDLLAPETGEDLRTEEFRWMVEAHVASRGSDDAVLWKMADLAATRLRQVHGLRYVDDPDRVSAMVGPLLAEWLSHDRRHRYDPAHRHVRYSVTELAEVVRRIEAL
jgi:hypothetical protein